MKNPSQALPVSEYLPIVLQRPLGLFGKSFPVHISTLFTLSPSTVSSAAAGIGLFKLIRLKEPQLEADLRSLRRAETKTNALSETTKKLVAKSLGRFIEPAALAQALAGEQVSHPPPWQSDWEKCLQGLGGVDSDDWFTQAVSQMGQLDRVFWTLLQMKADGRDKEARDMEAQSLWLNPSQISALYPGVQINTALLIETSLKLLAWIEIRFGDYGAQARELSGVKSLLREGRRPIGHWLIAVQGVLECRNLKELGNLTDTLVKRHKRFVGYDLLRKWSAGTQLMPLVAAQGILKLVDPMKRESHEKLFAVARFSSFLVDLLISGQVGAVSNWQEAQRLIFNRFDRLLDFEISRQKESQPSK